ncbi:MAG TPA: hypothetical protein VKV40_19645 [Ktedonobacteraceae bacterium]|nr:hypothetical protein [Ktedonobacteraceae bacterium]
MDDLHSMAINDEELLSFALGEEPLSEEASVHLEQCATCQGRLALYRETQAFLVSRLYRHSCPDATRLSFYCANLLPPDERIHIASHLRECPLCMAEVAETRAFLNDELLPEPLPVSLRGQVQRVFATLVRQRAQLVLRGERGENEKQNTSLPRWPRQYHAGTVDISLHLSRASNGDYVLLGIMTGADAEENIDAFASIQTNLYIMGEFMAADQEKRQPMPFLSTEVDDIGNFVFSPVPSGRYVMNIRLPEAELVIEDITIGQTRPLYP